MQYCDYDILSTEDLDFDSQAVPNFDSCINLCDANNVRNENTGCKALTYDFVGNDFLLCWLKNGTGTLMSNFVAHNAWNYSVSAVLQ
jgi:hypothetical protein